eukprot:gnl/TRDRNA2_/TRDRNA2_165145_c0_seq3.p1 gnl/TRDRNA2_/TRDRNA2_165145_c0~~gnl/TRDRNA2_/TRDRNA2_165145_c0_seq3.p1  ORF type:complete len:511 (-),score=93.46 gnl/TRDRNA2_/TRDRNA2_165145_c0_seq3:145-1677(-)
MLCCACNDAPGHEEITNFAANSVTAETAIGSTKTEAEEKLEADKPPPPEKEVVNENQEDASRKVSFSQEPGEDDLIQVAPTAGESTEDEGNAKLRDGQSTASDSPVKSRSSASVFFRDSGTGEEEEVPVMAEHAELWDDHKLKIRQSSFRSDNDLSRHPQISTEEYGKSGCCMPKPVEYYTLKQEFVVIRHSNRLDRTPNWKTYKDKDRCPHDTPITTNGRKNVQAMVAELKARWPEGKHPWSMIACSPYLRKPMHRSAEELSKIVAKEYPEVAFARTPDGYLEILGKQPNWEESFLHAQLRFAARFEQHVEKATQKLMSIIIVTHADCLPVLCELVMPGKTLAETGYACYVVLSRKVVVQKVGETKRIPNPHCLDHGSWMGKPFEFSVGNGARIGIGTKNQKLGKTTLSDRITMANTDLSKKRPSLTNVVIPGKLEEKIAEMEAQGKISKVRRETVCDRGGSMMELLDTGEEDAAANGLSICSTDSGWVDDDEDAPGRRASLPRQLDGE